MSERIGNLCCSSVLSQSEGVMQPRQLSARQWHSHLKWQHPLLCLRRLPHDTSDCPITSRKEGGPPSDAQNKRAIPISANQQ